MPRTYDPNETIEARRARSQAAGVAARRDKPKPKPIVPNPITTERGYAADEWEFLRAIDRYKLDTGTRFPTWAQALAILKSLGYARPEPDHADDAPHPPQPARHACTIRPVRLRTAGKPTH